MFFRSRNEKTFNTKNKIRRQHIAFADAGHFIPIDQFERFVEAVRQFLEPAF
jgi:hypothetical protein